jgi:ABC-type branched-subunit amino acid transport system substrate-binding protein
LTGVASVWGEEIAHAGELTVEMLNEQGGVLGREVKLFIQDDGTMPETAVPAAERLVKKFGCVLIIGNLMSNSRIAVNHQVAEPYRVVMNNFSFYEGSICGRYFFHMAAVPNQQLQKMIPWMAEKYGKRFYFIGNDYEWPRGSVAASKEALKTVGGEVLGEEYNPLGTADFSSILMKIKRAKPDVLIPFEVGTDQIAFLKQFTATGLKDKIAVVTCGLDASLNPGVEPAIRQGFYSCNTYFMSVPTKDNEVFLERLWKKYGKDAILTNFGEGVIPCIKIWAKAVEKAGTTNPDEVVKAQEGGPGQEYGMSATSPQGKVTVVKQHHHCIVQVYLTEWQADGSFKIVESWHDQDPIIPGRYGGCVASVAGGCRPLESKKPCPKFPGE